MPKKHISPTKFLIISCQFGRISVEVSLPNIRRIYERQILLAPLGHVIHHFTPTKMGPVHRLIRGFIPNLTPTNSCCDFRRVDLGLYKYHLYNIAPLPRTCSFQYSSMTRQGESKKLVPDNPWRIHGTNGICTFMNGWFFMENVGKYTMHGWYGLL